MAEKADTPAPATDSTALITEAKEYLQLCAKRDSDNREAGLDDLRFLAGDHWPAKVKRERELDGRPCLTVNKLPTFLHQVTNDQRMNVPGIKVSPVDSHADAETAKIVQGWIRHTEYSSNADIAYDTAVNSAAAIGVGYFRLVTDFCSEDSFDQDIRFRRIRNSFTVYMDPLSEEPDGSDQRRCMISGKMARTDFTREYPNTQLTTQGFSGGIGDRSNVDWIGEDFVRIAEYYRIEETPATLVELSNGETGFKEDLVALPEGVTITRERKSSRSKVMLYKLTALDVLESTEIKCKWIPVFPVYGDEIDIDGKVIRAGLVRNAKDPSKMYDFWMTSATEEVALRPKTPYIGASGQFEGFEDDWNAANVRSFSTLEYNPVSLDGVLAPPPQRQPMADIPNGMLTMAMHANDNIKATTGLFDSSLGARGNATSGVQERSQQRQGDMANFHYTDNLNRSVRHAGRCLVSMLPHYVDGTRLLRIMGEDDTISSVMVNQPIPLAQQKPDPETGAIKTVLNDLTIGQYDVTVKAGPSYSTLREEAADSMIEFGKSWPKLMDIAGDKVIRAMDWPGATEIADRVEKTIPAELRDEGDADDQAAVVNTPKGPIPVDQAAQMLQEMDQQIQQMGQQLQEAQSGIAKARVDAESRERVAEINAVAKSDVAELQGLIQILIAKMQPPPALAADVAQDLNDSSRPAPGAAAEEGANAQPPMGSPTGQEIAP
jgi:DNA-binding protein YbaB